MAQKFVMIFINYFVQMLVARKIEKSYGELQVLKGVDLSIYKGEIVSIVGSSGAGKSTLLHIIGTLDAPDKGEVLLNGKRIDNLTGKALATCRNKNIGFIFQFRRFFLRFSSFITRYPSRYTYIFQSSKLGQ